MARPVLDFEIDPVVVPILDNSDLDIDEWLASLRLCEDPIDLPVPAAELVAEARRMAGSVEAPLPPPTTGT